MVMSDDTGLSCCQARRSNLQAGRANHANDDVDNLFKASTFSFVLRHCSLW